MNRSPTGRPVACDGPDGAWVVSSHAAARSILVNAGAAVPADPAPGPFVERGALASVVERGAHLRGLWMWGCHTERRAICHKVAAMALGQDSVNQLTPYLISRASELLDAARHDDEIDLVTDFAQPLVRDSVMELFGVPLAARAAMETQVRGMTSFIPGSDSSKSAGYFAVAATGQQLEKLWEKPLPPSAVASRVLRDAVQAGTLSLDEALAQATLLLFGNSYTTLDALSGLLARLAQQPALWQAARNGSVAVSALVEEGLRLGPPANLILFRDAAQDIECAGSTIPAGARIVLPLDRLNRDPACFPDADTFDPTRSGPAHLAFGAGRHMCVGLHLARAVIRTSVEALLGRMPEWPRETRTVQVPGVLGGPTLSSLLIPAGALRPC